MTYTYIYSLNITAIFFHIFLFIRIVFPLYCRHSCVAIPGTTKVLLFGSGLRSTLYDWTTGRAKLGDDSIIPRYNFYIACMISDPRKLPFNMIEHVATLLIGLTAQPSRSTVGCSYSGGQRTQQGSRWGKITILSFDDTVIDHSRKYFSSILLRTNVFPFQIP